MIARKPTIIGVGMATVDLLQVMPHFPAEGSENRVIEEEQALGGPIGRGIATCSRLGARTHLYGMCGKGLYAEFLKKLLENENINYHLVQAPETVASQHSVVILAKNGTARTTLWHPQPKMTEECLEAARSVITQADAVLVDCSDMQLCSEVAHMCREYKIPSILDTGSLKPGVESALGLVDYIIVPEKFLAALYPDTLDLQTSLVKFSARTSAILVAVTLGERGGISYHLPTGSIFKYEANRIEARDTCGAGDTFHGAFAYGIAQNLNYRDALKLASWAAAKKCSALGNKNLPSNPEYLTWARNLGIEALG